MSKLVLICTHEGASWYVGPIYEDNTWGYLKDQIMSEIEVDEFVTGEFKLTVKLMTQEQIDALPEFEGF